MRVLMADPGGPPQAGALQALAAALTGLGATVTDVRVPADQPASVFIRDVVLLPSPDPALVLRPHGHRGTTEPAAVADALRALGLGPGDEVVVPPRTFVASASAVEEAARS